MRFRLTCVIWRVIWISGLLTLPIRPGTAAAEGCVNFGTTQHPAGSGPLSVALGDFNGDGKLDLAVGNASSGELSVLLGTGTGSFGPPMNLSAWGPTSIAVADFNHDGKLDLATTGGAPGGVALLMGRGTGQFDMGFPIMVGWNDVFVATGDFNEDGNVDLVVANYSIYGNIAILLGSGTGSFGTPMSFFAAGTPSSVAVGDFDGDGHADLAVANRGFAGVSILLGTGTGSFGELTNYPVGPDNSLSDSFSIAVADFNADGKADLVVAQRYANGVSVLLGTGTGAFGPPTSFPTGTGAVSVAVGDFNGDAKPDLAVANDESNEVSILFGTGTGSFRPATHFAADIGPWSVAVGDVNGDGKPDVVTANFGAGDVSVLLNTYPACPEYYTLLPCRAADTRQPIGPSGGPALGADATRKFPLTGVCGIPPGATAVTGNVTAVQPDAYGHLTLYPGNNPSVPLVTNVNFSPGQTRSNNAVLLLATNGTIAVKNRSPGVVHFVLDVSGYFR